MVSMCLFRYLPVCVENVFKDLERRIVQSEQNLCTNNDFLRKDKDIARDFRESNELFGQNMSDQEWSAQTMSMVHELAQANKVDIQELNALLMEYNKNIHISKVQLSALADWTSLMAFFVAVQGPMSRFDADEMVLEKSTGNPGLVHCQMTLSRWAFVPQQD